VSGVAKKENILIHDAYENNLKHIDVTIEENAFTCVTGVSGCGKSSLVYDTLYAESQRNFLESMSSNMFGQKIMDKPKVKAIENLRPALSVAQNYYNNNPRSTVGTLTDISHYLRAMYALVKNFEDKTSVSDSYFSSNNPESCCPYCSGVGFEYDIDESKVIPDRKKSLKKGAILYYSGSAKSMEVKLLEAICDKYGINTDLSVDELTSQQLDKLLYRKETLVFQLSFKSPRGTTRRKSIESRGAMVELREKLSDIDTPSTKISIAKYLIQKECSHCHGSKLNPVILENKICGLNIAEVEHLKINKIKQWLDMVDSQYSKSEISSQVGQLVQNISNKIECITNLSVDYLSVDRSVPTLSGGEIQRIRIANQLNCPLRGLVYILDEPCKGLHVRNINNIIDASKKLVEKGNTVVAIEHNPYYISSSDYVIELGPVGGVDGGEIIYSGKSKKKKIEIDFKPKQDKYDKWFSLNNINYHNISGQDVTFPVGFITCVTGVSGSGKSSLVSVIEESISNAQAIYCNSIDGLKHLKHVQRVNQQPIGKNSRSTIVSYLDIYDDIRNLYADAAGKKYSASDFSMNVSGGRCECCQGNGKIKIELNYLPESYVTCPECNGTRFKKELLDVKVFGRNISETLTTPINELADDFKELEPVYRKLNCMIEIGLGYLCLGQMSMHLSGGEAQRIKLAKVLGNNSSKNTLFILDEPTSGLSEKDIARLKTVIELVQSMGNTVLIIEHNMSFVAQIADYMIDFGQKAGDEGGKIVAYGYPEEVYNSKDASWKL